SFAQLVPIVDRATAEAGDVVTVDYTAHVGGRLIGRADNREIEIGANGFPPEIDRALTGAAVGAELRVSATYPADRGGPEVAGKTVDFVVHVQRLSRKELPVLDDD